MLPDRVSNPGPLNYESGALSIALRGPAGGEIIGGQYVIGNGVTFLKNNERDRYSTVVLLLRYTGI